jgi:hypothetical protein
VSALPHALSAVSLCDSSSLLAMAAQAHLLLAEVMPLS